MTKKNINIIVHIPRKFYFADAHLGHNAVITMDNRPFKFVTDMNKAIINNYNDVIKTNDEVFMLGDIFWNRTVAEEFLPLMKGKKTLVKGNHDKINDVASRHFDTIVDSTEVRDGDYKIILSHYPIAFWKGQHRGSYHLHGHTHATIEHTQFLEFLNSIGRGGTQGNKGRAINVGVMHPWINYTPRTFEEIISY